MSENPLEQKQTQCSVCKKGKRESDAYCSEKCQTNAAVVAHAGLEAARQRSIPFGICPTCGGEALVVCRCTRADSRCANGHWWHYDENSVHPGESDHASVVCCYEQPIARWKEA